ncbi:MAG: hypothetical protein QOK25_901, partial [Thermoleophilaceae bacterium]|nr:hypothetical protein [Thermoleophilaceae bacterium]
MRVPARSPHALAAAAALLATGAIALAVVPTPGGQVSPKSRILPSGRHLLPAGKLVRLGNFPTGGAVTANGRFYWTVSAGDALNDVRIVSLRSGRVIQAIKLPGASGGVALDSARRLAYVSGLPDTDVTEVKTPAGTPGKDGDVIHVFSWSKRTGKAVARGVIAVPPPSDAPTPQSFPPDPTAKKRSWPERLAVSADGGTLLVPLGLADAAAIVDTRTKAVRYVNTGSHPYGAAILPGGKTGLVSNRGPGTVSVIDLKAGTKVKDIQVGAHLSHPESIALDSRRGLAYVPLANADSVAVVDTRKLALARTLTVARAQGAGTAPVDTAVSRDGRYLLVAESAADEIAVFALPRAPAAHARAARAKRASGKPFALIGRVPTAQYPADVDTIGRGARSPCGLGSRAKPAKGKRRRRPACTKLVWTAARGFGLGPNLGTPPASQYFDIPHFLTTKGKVTGYAGILDFPGKRQLRKLTATATAQLTPVNHEAPPPGTPLRPGGPIKHVFYIVRENRTYDQV